jgi:RNA polymerase sigma-70 factor (ECF subfamily)
MNSHEIIDQYYRASRSEIVKYVSLRLHNSDEAEDLVQNVFLRLLSGHRLISEVTLPHLVYTLCRHLIVDWYRRHAVRSEAETELRMLYGGMDSAESGVLVRDLNEQLEHGLTRVPEKCRELYRMHIYDGLKAGDICQLTDLPYKTVEYQLGMARKQVRTYLQKIS